MESFQVSRELGGQQICLEWSLMMWVCVQIYSNRELEDQLTKIREVLSDEKHDWEQRVVAVRVTQIHIESEWTWC